MLTRVCITSTTTVGAASFSKAGMIGPPSSPPNGPMPGAGSAASGADCSLAVAGKVREYCMTDVLYSWCVFLVCVLGVACALVRLVTSIMYLYIQSYGKKNVSPGSWRFAALEPEHECGAVVSEQLFGSGLGTLPGRCDARQQLSSIVGDLEGRAARIVLVRYLFDPALLEHHAEVSGEGRRVEVQALAEINSPHGTCFRHRDKQAQLARFKPERSHLGFIETGQHAARLAPVPQKAFARNLLDNGLNLGTRHDGLQGDNCIYK